MRVDDYRYYSQLCLGFGILLLIIGIVLPIFTMSWYTNIFGTTVYEIPYLGQGVALVVVGVILIVLSQILIREYRFKMQGQIKPVAPSLGYCPYCGTAREEGAAYCRKCGKKLP